MRLIIYLLALLLCCHLAGGKNATGKATVVATATVRQGQTAAALKLLATGFSALPMAVTLLPRAFSYVFHFTGDVLVLLSAAIDRVFLSKTSHNHHYNIVTIGLKFIHDRLLSLSANMFENEKTCLHNVQRLETLMDKIGGVVAFGLGLGQVSREEARRRIGRQRGAPHFDIKSLRSDRNSLQLHSSSNSGARQHLYPPRKTPLAVDRGNKAASTGPRGAGYKFTTDDVIRRAKKSSNTVAVPPSPSPSSGVGSDEIAGALRELYPLVRQWVTDPVFDPSEGAKSSVAAHLLLGLAAVALACSASYKSPVLRFAVVCFTVLAVWLTIVCLEQIYRKKELTKCSIDSVNDYIKTRSHSNASALSFSEDFILSDEGFEHSAWANALLESLWTINGTAGGLGPYISGSMQQVLRTELQAVPRSVAHLQIDTFTLGTHPFVLRSVRVVGPRAGADSFAQAVKMHSSRAAAAASPPAEGGTAYRRIRSYISSFANSYPGESANSTPVSAPVGQLEHIVVDCDLAYVSRDMNIILNVRSNDIMSVLHETKVKLSELAISGRVRFRVDLLPEYPFIGNATVSFVRLPKLDFALSTFG